MTSTPSESLAAALDYAGRGLPVHPVTRDKRPCLRAWPDQASTDPDTCAGWWGPGGAFVGCGVAIALPGGVVGLDLDDVDQVAGWLRGQGYTLPTTATVLTPRGGRHLYYLSQIPFMNAVKPLPGLDVRARGGYLVAPPSETRHGRYRWVVGLDNMADAPEWLARELGTSSAPAPDRPPATNVGVWRALAAGPIVEGTRNTTAARLAGHLLRRRVDAVVVLELLTAWNATRCQPPLVGSEILTIVNSVAGAELRRRGGAA